MIPILPFVPSPYPDEILGSWLARIFLHVGRGAWHPLLESAGYGRRTEALFFDVVDYSDKLDKLLCALGTTYEKTITELTTLPYWLAFDAASLSEGYLPGTTAIPKQIDYLGKTLHSIGSRGIGRSPSKSFQPRFCPRCLARDSTVYGEPYWHLSHQLPNLLFCPEHHCPLQTGCPRCGRMIVTIAKRLIDVPRLKCACGFDFRNVPRFDQPPDVYKRLTQISVEALNCTQPSWHHEQVRIYLHALLDESELERYDLTLASAFKVTRDSNTRLFAELPGKYGISSKLWLRGYLGMAAAPECCALLVALGIGFNQFTLGLTHATSDEHDTSQNPFRSCLWTIASARAEIVRRVAVYHHRPPSGHKTLYWFLRIHDAEWLFQQFPTLLGRRMPSVNEDRRRIRTIATDHNLPANIRQRTITHIAAGMRADIRDQEWLHKQICQLQNERRLESEVMIRSNLDHHASAIEAALEKLLSDDGIPTRIIIGNLASTAELKRTQVEEAIRTNPGLRETIVAINNDKHRRQLVWAIRQLRAPGHRLSVCEICKLARLPRSAATSSLILDIVSKLK